MGKQIVKKTTVVVKFNDYKSLQNKSKLEKLKKDLCSVVSGDISQQEILGQHIKFSTKK